MYAIVEIAGQQFKVAKDQKVFVHRLSDQEGDKVTFDKVLLLDDGNVTIGAPVIEGAAVTAKVLRHLKGDKVIVFKKKRRKGYQVKNGHRQAFTELQIDSIASSGAKPSSKKTVKKESKVEAPAPVAAKPTKKVTSKADDLRKVEGIGPKIAEIFANAGIDTFAKLAKTDVAKLEEILAAAGSRYASKKPGTWPKQAEMAAEGKWDELNKWQDELDGGIQR